jgi:WD40 repeat protein
MWPFLLLAASAASESVPPYVSAATVFFEGGQTVRIHGPEGTQDVRYTLASLIGAPGGAFKVAHWCWEFTKFWQCQTQLVSSSGAQTWLKNGSVRQLVFTPDGRWLAGMGDNTLWLWDLQRPAAAPRTRVLPMQRLERLSLRGGQLCVSGSGKEFVLAWPSLKLLQQQEQPRSIQFEVTMTAGNSQTTTGTQVGVAQTRAPLCP